MAMFFLPGSGDDKQAEEAYANIKQNVAQITGRRLSDARYHTVSYEQNTRWLKATVGEMEPRSGEVVVAILATDDSDLFLVCTPTRGVVKGEPIIVGNHFHTTAAQFSKN